MFDDGESIGFFGASAHLFSISILSGSLFSPLFISVRQPICPKTPGWGLPSQKTQKTKKKNPILGFQKVTINTCDVEGCWRFASQGRCLGRMVG